MSHIDDTIANAILAECADNQDKDRNIHIPLRYMNQLLTESSYPVEITFRLNTRADFLAFYELTRMFNNIQLTHLYYHKSNNMSINEYIVNDKVLSHV